MFYHFLLTFFYATVQLLFIKISRDKGINIYLTS